MSALSYAVIGTGAIGGYYGGRLQQAGCDVHFLLRSDYVHVQKSGLRVESIDGDFVLPKVKAYRQSADMPPVDVAIVALKTTHNHQLCELLPPLKPGGAILFLQNGLGVEESFAQQLKEKALPVPTLIGGLCFICASKIAPGHIRHDYYGSLLLGAHADNAQPAAPTPPMQAMATPLHRRIAADFAESGIAADITDDLPMARWQKLVWNVPYNGLSVVLNATTEAMMANGGDSGGLAEDRELGSVRSLITTLMEEVVAIANAWGEATSPSTHRKLPADIISKMLATTETMPPYRTSMKLDYDRGRPLELTAILEEPIRIAQTLSVPIPRIKMLYQQLTFLDNTNRVS